MHLLWKYFCEYFENFCYFFWEILNISDNFLRKNENTYKIFHKICSFSYNFRKNLKFSQIFTKQISIVDFSLTKSFLRMFMKFYKFLWFHMEFFLKVLSLSCSWKQNDNWVFKSF